MRSDQMKTERYVCVSLCVSVCVRASESMSKGDFKCIQRTYRQVIYISRIGVAAAASGYSEYKHMYICMKARLTRSIDEFTRAHSLGLSLSLSLSTSMSLAVVQQNLTVKTRVDV